jgi:hypothetical protein
MYRRHHYDEQHEQLPAERRPDRSTDICHVRLIHCSD